MFRFIFERLNPLTGRPQSVPVRRARTDWGPVPRARSRPLTEEQLAARRARQLLEEEYIQRATDSSDSEEVYPVGSWN